MRELTASDFCATAVTCRNENEAYYRMVFLASGLSEEEWDALGDVRPYIEAVATQYLVEVDVGYSASGWVLRTMAEDSPEYRLRFPTPKDFLKPDARPARYDVKPLDQLWRLAQLAGSPVQTVGQWSLPIYFAATKLVDEYERQLFFGNK